jgi:hypothetical protein
LIHQLIIGHFDAEALKDRRLVVLRPLDMSVVTRLLKEFGQITDDGRAILGGHAVEIVKDGYVVCPWLMALRNQPAEEFARRLHQETGCVLYDAGRREIITPEQFATW